MKRKLGIFLSLLFVFSVMFSIIPSGVDTVYADDEDGFLVKDNLETGSSNRSKFAEDDEKFFYRLEAGMPKEDKSRWYNLPGKTADAVSTAINETIMAFNKIVFWLNQQVAKFAIGALEKANNFSFVDNAIDKISNQVKNLVGISGTSFSSSGMFLPILKIIALVVVLYAFYQLIWKRSFISSLGELFKFVIVLATSLLLFANFSTFLTGMNNLSNEVGDFIVGAYGTTSEDAHESRVTGFSEALWEHFVDKPYLTLQYGTDDVSLLETDEASGNERIRMLLNARTGSETRSKIVDNEINEIENYYMTYDSVFEKTASNLVFFFINFLTSIPVLIIAMAIMFTHYWYIIIAMIAPFALLIASFPSQFNTLKRYSFELTLPLIIKIGLHFALVIIMVLTSVVSDVQQTIQSDMFEGHIGTAFMNGILYAMLFFGIFILRNRIANLLTSGSEKMQEIREGMSSVTTEPVQKGIQTGAVVTGAAAGAAVGMATTGASGVMGMAHGANIGGTVGKVASGGSDGIAGATQDIGRLAFQHEMLKNKKNRKNNSHDSTSNQSGSFNEGNEGSSTNENSQMTPEQRQSSRTQEIEHEENLNKGIESLQEFGEQQGFNSGQTKNLAKNMMDEKVDFSKIKPETLERHNTEGKAIENPQEFARSLKKDQQAQQEKVNEIRTKRTEGFNNFLEKQNLNSSEIESINNHLESKAIDVAHIPKSDYVKADQEIRERLKQGESISYTDEFKKNLEEKAEHRRMAREGERVMNSSSGPTSTLE